LFYVLYSAVIAELDEEKDSEMDLSNIFAAPLKPIVHG
jgi:hypothetical protein